MAFIETKAVTATGVYEMCVYQRQAATVWKGLAREGG